MVAGRATPSRQRYPPLLALVAGVVLAIVVLPSALNLPQSNPTQTAEYAPVPGQNGSSANGNAASLGLAGSSDLTDSVATPTATPGSGDLSPNRVNGTPTSHRPTGKSCVFVNGALHQSEDPLSPPCVAYFNGDNGGATAPGVTGTEVRVIAYFDGGQATQSSTICNQFWDLALPPAGDEASVNVFSETVKSIRAYQAYFNNRYQTYGRTVHFWAQIGSCDYSAQSRRADAAEAVQRHPFAVVDVAGVESGGAALDAYDDAIAAAHILVFAGYFGDRQASFYSQFPGFIWGYEPTLEHDADLLVAYLCTEALPNPAHFSGNALDNGKPRTFGLLYQDETGFDAQRILGERVKAGFEQTCNGHWTALHTYTGTLDGSATSNTGDPNQAAQNWADFKTKSVTTVIWLGGWNTADPAAASAIQYRPELIVLGYGYIDNTATAKNFDQSVMSHAFVVADRVFNPPTQDEPCSQAMKEATPQASSQDVYQGCAFTFLFLRQLFTAVEVAGPRLSAATIDEGMHAIPAIVSTDPTVPACFYPSNGYTCVQDAEAMWWDPSGVDPTYQNNYQGCWRAVERGHRHLVGQWPSGNVDSLKQPNDPCNPDA